MKTVVWWVIRIVCGFFAVLGAFYAAMGAVELYYLLSGRIVPDMNQPGVRFVATYWIIGLVLMTVGYKTPSWLNIDRLL